jgi:hypothetical protein
LADDVQARLHDFAFDIRAVWEFGPNLGTDRTALPGIYAVRDKLRRAYEQYRQIVRNVVVHDTLVDELDDTDHFADFLNLYFYTLQRLATMLNAMKLYQHNDAMSSLSSDISTYTSRIIRLYRRLAKIPMLPFLKSYAIRCGQLVETGRSHAVMIRHYNHAPHTGDIYGGSTDYQSDLSVWVTGGSTEWGKWLSNVEAALWALEGYITYDADVKADFIAIKEMIAAVSQVREMQGIWQPGLPDISSYPGVVSDMGMLTEMYTRAYITKEKVSGDTDQWTIFPVPGDTLVNSLIPVKSYAPFNPIFDTLPLGLPKFGFFSAGLELLQGAVDTSEGAVIGTDIHYNEQADPEYGNDRLFAETGAASDEYVYTRNDGWDQIGNEEGYDYSDELLNSDANYRISHIWRSVLSVGSVDARRWVQDNIGIVHEHWQPAQHFMEDWLMFICGQLKLPPGG